ncbi:MAG: HYExAFE family protein [Phycisphaerales bacterium]
MAQRRHHYEVAFEEYLRARRIPYVSVNEARKALLPPDASFSVRTDPAEASATQSLKCFDFVVYSDRVNLLVDVKGRKVARRKKPQSGAALAAVPRSGLESWVTREDVDSLSAWRRLFGEGFDAAFVFVYWCDDQPPDGLFQEVFEHRGRWYAVRSARMDPYVASMRERSAKWRTVHVPARDFERISEPFLLP